MIYLVLRLRPVWKRLGKHLVFIEIRVGFPSMDNDFVIESFLSFIVISKRVGHILLIGFVPNSPKSDVGTL